MQLYKKILPLSLVLVMLAQAFIKTGVVVYYYTNQSDIVQNLCVNRNKPELTCAGKCMLDTWMKKADNGDDTKSPGAPTFKQVQDIVLFFETPAVFLLFLDGITGKSATPVVPEDMCSIFPEDIFHPPA